MERFWSKVNKTDSCWEWTAGKTRTGYGRFWFNGRAVNAHRLAYELEVAPVPRGLEIDHLCSNRACVRPSHLEAVTHAENLRRGDTLAGRNVRKTHCKHGHPFDEENTYWEGVKRKCQACRRQAERRYARKSA